MFDATQQDVSCGGGVGWGGCDDVHLHLRTCLVWWRSFALAHMFDATQQDVSCGGGVGWGGYDDVHLHLHTCLMLRNRMFHVGVGWGGVGMMTFLCTCTHV